LFSEKKLQNIEIGGKILMVLLFSFFLYYEIFYKKNSAELWQTYQKQLLQNNPWWLVTAFLLMPLNWLLEALKWRRLADVFEHFSIWLAFKAVLAGATIGIFTPNRVGEYGGRLLFTPKDKAVETVIATLLGSFSQLLALFGGGFIGLYFFLDTFFPDLHYILLLLSLACIVAYGIILFFFYNSDLLLNVFKRIYHFLEKKVLARFLEKKYFQIIFTLVKGWLKHVKVLKKFTTRQLSEALLMAFLRYMVYSLQYFCVLQFMGIHASIGISAACIATIFLLQTCLPLPPVTGLFARGGTAVYIWGFCGANELSILATTFGLWIINIIIPALFGLFFILRKNYFSK
jgi:uncharacterized membrane protein YbhN (UPF0104 family)